MDDKYANELLKNRKQAVDRYMGNVVRHLPLDIEMRHTPSGIAFVRMREKQAVTLAAWYVLELLAEPVDHKLLAMEIERMFETFEAEKQDFEWKATRVNCWRLQNPPKNVLAEVYFSQLGNGGYRGTIKVKPLRGHWCDLLRTDELDTPEEAKERCEGFIEALAYGFKVFEGEEVGTEVALQPQRKSLP